MCFIASFAHELAKANEAEMVLWQGPQHMPLKPAGDP